MELYELAKSCYDAHLEFRSLYRDYTGRYVITAHDVKLAGRKPELNEMRDALDYQHAMDNWNRRGLIILAIDDDPYGALNLALENLDKLHK